MTLTNIMSKHEKIRYALSSLAPQPHDTVRVSISPDVHPSIVRMFQRALDSKGANAEHRKG